MQKSKKPLGPKYKAETLIDWSTNLLEREGLEHEKALVVASVLVEADLFGHFTHGLVLLGPYLRRLQQGTMARTGEINVLSERASVVFLDGSNLPGPWLVKLAIKQASEGCEVAGTTTVLVKKSGHIGCLSCYLEEPARKGLIVEIMSSDPSMNSVAPFGGTESLFSTNPIAIGIPTDEDPILVDMSTAVLSSGMASYYRQLGEGMPFASLFDGEGRPSIDPMVLESDPRGSIQPLGGLDAGHKGFGLTLFVEAMTGCLASFGRADAIENWGATFLVRVTDPDAFGGLEGFVRQSTWIAKSCRQNRPIDSNKPVRLPGQNALAHKRSAIENGLVLNPIVQNVIEQISDQYQTSLPKKL